MIIFALPYAVGNSSIFFDLKRSLGNSVKLIALDYSGHGIRISEPLMFSIDEITEDIYKQIRNIGIDEDYCILGYSMGSVIAKELYMKLLSYECNLPKYIFLCACSEPGHKRKKRNIANCSRNDLINILREYSGTSEEVFECDELLDLILPILKADFSALENYQPQESFGEIISGGIILYSNEEKMNIKKWDRYFKCECIYEKIDAGHFFINDYYVEMAEIIKSIIQ